MNLNAYRTRAERGEVQLGTWITMIRTPSVLTLLQAAGLDFARVDMERRMIDLAIEEIVEDVRARPPKGRPTKVSRPKKERRKATPEQRRKARAKQRPGRRERAARKGQGRKR